MYNNVQEFCANIGRYGCLVLCYIHIAEKITNKKIDALRAILKLVQLGHVEYDTSDKTHEKILYVKSAEDVLHELTGQRFSVTKSSKLPDDVDNCYVINEYRCKNLGKSYTHFSCNDFKPIAVSFTEQHGWIDGYRIITKKES